MMNMKWVKRIHFWHLGTFWTNPQFRVNVPEPDEDDEDGLASVIVGVMQKGRRQMRNIGKDMQPIGYEVFKVGG